MRVAVRVAVRAAVGVAAGCLTHLDESQRLNPKHHRQRHAHRLQLCAVKARGASLLCHSQPCSTLTCCLPSPLISPGMRISTSRAPSSRSASIARPALDRTSGDAESVHAPYTPTRSPVRGACALHRHSEGGVYRGASLGDAEAAMTAMPMAASSTDAAGASIGASGVTACHHSPSPAIVVPHATIVTLNAPAPSQYY